MSQTNDHPQLIQLLNKVGDLLGTRQQMTQQKVSRLITETAPHVARIEKDHKEKALKFNVFSALGVTRKEVIHSRFLAYLLDPNEHHGQDSIFLNAFLTKIGIPEIGAKNTEQIKRVRVTTEHSTGEALGRMDIVLFCQPGWLVVIENKVDAGEAAQQLTRYTKWLDRQQGYNQKKLIFLTPTGHESVTAKAGDYLQLSYLDLAEAFSLFLDQDQIKAESVRIVLTQYITICKLIAGMDMAIQDKQLVELLKEPDNIRIALEIEQQTQFIRSQVVKEFGEHIQKILQRKLESANLEKIWKADPEFYSDNTLNVKIRTMKHQAKPNYSMFAQHIFSLKNMGWSGWYRPQWIDFKNQSPATLDTKELTDKMTSTGCKGEEAWWIGWQDLCFGKKGFLSTDIDDIVACLEDNRTEDHPLADTIAEELWLMFVTYREDIEALDSFKQAATL
ncbi:MAG: PD-(D/E)XK nuclease family protein [Methylobacter sp.]|nr:PD-(D/E)XK nuclease family protein [Methylobacter sp.]